MCLHTTAIIFHSLEEEETIMCRNCLIVVQQQRTCSLKNVSELVSLLVFESYNLNP